MSTEIQFTNRELDVMAVLWRTEGATVAEVQEQLGDELAYTTVLTILRTLEEKGHVGHTQEGKAYRYRPLVDRELAGASAVRRLIGKMFQGSPELLLTHLVSDRALSKKDLEELRRLVDQRLGKKE
ncbi:MAG: BlaI/MecI/CopY family transcriptional regulator [Gemmatimonadetes bacterium]|nr:BlaI/MecI/CopY family transcriptional regulator [Gemmatimonadota bacterium]